MKTCHSPGWLAATCALLTIVLFAPVPASAQLNGSNIPGEYGVGSGTQASPGLWVGGFYYRYSTDDIRDSDGHRLALNPDQPASAAFPAFAPTIVYVSKLKIFGGTWGALVAPGVGQGSLEAPAFGIDREVSTGPTDTYIVPLQLGWHIPQADFVASAGVWAPTGRYHAGSLNNTGRGMWSWEAAGGTTVFLDPERAWSIATVAFYETHSKKKGTTVSFGDQISLGGVRVGDVLTLQGGLARELAGGLAHAGVAYYAQWKVTDDDFGIPITTPDGAPLSRHRVFGVGPDVAIPIGTKSTLVSVVTVRYFWELGAQVKTQGQTLLVAVSAPVPSLRLR